MKKTKYITFSLCDPDYEELKKQAEEDQRTLANYISIIILKFLRGKKDAK